MVSPAECRTRAAARPLPGTPDLGTVPLALVPRVPPHEQRRTPAEPPRLFGDTSGEGGGAPLAAGEPPVGRPHSHTTV